MDKKKLSELTVTRIRSVSTIYTAQHATSRRTCRPCWAIVYKWEGETEYHLPNGKSCISNSRHPVILPCGSDYEWLCTRAGRYSIVEFDADAACTGLIDFHISATDQLLAALRKLEETCTLKRELWQMDAKNQIYAILLNLLRSAPTESYTTSRKLDMIRPAVDFMHLHYDRSMTNEELAAMTAVSTVYFRKIFTQIYGMSPIHYLHHLRAEKAKEILRSDFGSITDVAASLGYQSIYHFSKAFKRSTGLSPSEYLKAGNGPRT